MHCGIQWELLNLQLVFRRQFCNKICIQMPKPLQCFRSKLWILKASFRKNLCITAWKRIGMQNIFAKWNFLISKERLANLVSAEICFFLFAELMTKMFAILSRLLFLLFYVFQATVDNANCIGKLALVKWDFFSSSPRFLTTTSK